MQTNWKCRVCGCNIRPWVSICESCRDERIYYWAMVSTNKTRLKKTLNERKVTKEWLDRVANQTNNILENWEILLTYK